MIIVGLVQLLKVLTEQVNVQRLTKLWQIQARQKLVIVHAIGNLLLPKIVAPVENSYYSVLFYVR